MVITIRWSHVAIVLAFALGLLLVLALARLTEGDASETVIKAQSPSPEPELAAVTPTQAAAPEEAAPALAAVEEPAATVEPPRSCEEIRASGSYRDEAERQAFLSTCVGPAPAARVPAVATAAPPVPARPAAGAPAPQPRPPSPVFDGSVALIGAVWPDELRPVPYCVNANDAPIGSNGLPILSPQQFSSLVQAAFNTWQAIPESNISFSYQGLCQSDPWNSRDGVNTVGWGWLFGAAIGLADTSGTHGRFIRQSTLGQLYEVDILIDIRYAQSFDDPATYIAAELPHILLHEAGHFIGLGHSTNPCSVMFPSGIGKGLCSVDVAAAAMLYPMP